MHESWAMWVYLCGQLVQSPKMKGGKLLVTSMKSRMVTVPQLKRRVPIVNIMVGANVALWMFEHALSCDACVANMLVTCLAFIMQFLVHRVTWQQWPFKRKRIPLGWGGCRRECMPVGGRKRDCWQAGVLTKVCRSMFTAVIQYAELRVFVVYDPVTEQTFDQDETL